VHSFAAEAGTFAVVADLKGLKAWQWRNLKEVFEESQ